jgi:hypothetical protein
MGLACLALQVGALGATPTPGALLIAHADVPADRIATAVLKNIYAGRTMYWDGGQRVVIAVLPDLTDSALKELSGMDASQFRTFWQRLVFSGRGQQPLKANDVSSLVALVAATKGAVALVPANAVLHGVKIIEVQ